jgi:hypothetical protein
MFTEFAVLTAVSYIMLWVFCWSVCGGLQSVLVHCCLFMLMLMIDFYDGMAC